MIITPIVFYSFEVETYGSMEKEEKIEFILEQMRLCLARNDYIRTQIISKKVSIKYFEGAESSVSIGTRLTIHIFVN